VINIDVLDQAGEFVMATPTDLEGEDVAERLTRRRRTWTPAKVVVGR
jgi:hypothetical protein